MADLVEKTYRRGHYSLKFKAHAHPDHLQVDHEGWSSASTYGHFPQNEGVAVVRGRQIFFQEANINENVYLVLEIVDPYTLKVISDHQNGLVGQVLMSS